MDLNLNVVALTVSWHTKPEDVAVRRAAPPGFTTLGQARKSNEQNNSTNGGGILFYLRKGLTVSELKLGL